MAHSLSQAPPTATSVGEYVVRRYEANDATALVAAVTDSIEHLRPWMPWIEQEPQSVQQRQEQIGLWAHEWDAKENFTMGIFLDNILVGSTGLHLHDVRGSLEIGYWVRAQFLGRGIATAVSQALTSAAFDLPEISTVQILHDAANIPSGKVPEKLGFTMIEESPRQIETSGEVGVTRRWQMTRDAWHIRTQAQ